MYTFAVQAVATQGYQSLEPIEDSVAKGFIYEAVSKLGTPTVYIRVNMGGTVVAFNTPPYLSDITWEGTGIFRSAQIGDMEGMYDWEEWGIVPTDYQEKTITVS
jgi:hypothetical protein